MKLDEKQEWYMTDRWKDCICNSENYSWDDNFIWGDQCDYNDGFHWQCNDDCNLVHSNYEIEDCEVEENIEDIDEDIDEDIEENIRYIQGPEGQIGRASCRERVS